jgi:putative SOS response-associated peptidase YedK
VVWLAINDDGPPTCFAGIRTMNGLLRGHLDHEVEAGPSPHNVYGFRTTPPKAVVEPLHPKAMPLILMTDEERDVWNAGAVG